LVDQHVLEHEVEIGLEEGGVAVLDDVDLVVAGASTTRANLDRPSIPRLPGK